jgi:hypothetical protein
MKNSLFEIVRELLNINTKKYKKKKVKIIINIGVMLYFITISAENSQSSDKNLY